jgi:two-component system, NarL family, invasion response regulator UvrY
MNNGNVAESLGMAKKTDPTPQRSILVVDDHEIVRDGISRIIKTQFQNYEPKTVSTYGEAIEAMHANHFSLVITDLSILGRGGIDLIQEIAGMRPTLPILVFSMHGEKDYGLRAIKSGAWGYVQKSDGVGELTKAIDHVLAGKRYVSQDLAQSLVSFFRKDTDRPPHDLLSAREFQIACKLANGMSAKAIAGELFLSVKTVSTYRARVFEKLGVGSIADLVRYALDHNLT